MHYIIVDLEATCCQNNEFPRSESDIIEIGAVLTDSQFNIISSFSTFAYPATHPQLTAFCTNLTSITQADIDDAPSFEVACTSFQTWWMQALEDTGDSEVCWGSWGDYDKNQFIRSCTRARVDSPCPVRHINFKTQVARELKVKPRGIARTLSLLEMQFEGTHHRGIDDARMVARILHSVNSARK